LFSPIGGDKMFVNILIYFYFMLCVLILLYTVYFTSSNIYIEYKNKRNVSSWKKAISAQIINIIKEKSVEKEFLGKLRKDLIRGRKLMNFHHALECFDPKQKEFQIFLDQLEECMIDIAVHYGIKESMEKAYFANFFGCFSRGKWTEEKFLYIFIDYLDDSNVYVRENVLQAIYSSGRIEWVVRIFGIFTEHEWFHHSKLIGDGLFRFTGDKKMLSLVLWSHRKEYTLSICLGIIQFITMSSDQFQEKMLHTSMNEYEDMEIRLGAIRYLSRYPYKPAEEILFGYLLHKNHEFQLRVVAARALGSYDSKETIEVLKEGLSDPNWYVRFNASESLIELKVNLMNLKEILIGDDQYARDILLYRINKGRENIHV